jgi:hypothetical protein
MQTSRTGGNAGDSVLKLDLCRGQTIARQLGTHRTLIKRPLPALLAR